VTEEKRNRETLRDREALLRAIGDNLPGGAIYRYLMPAGTEGSYTYVSQGIARMCGVTPEDLTSGRVRFRDWMNDIDQRRMAAAATRSRETFEPVHQEVRMTLPDGSEPIWQWRAVPYRLDDGGVGWDGIILDVTEQRQLESQVQQAQKFQTISVLAGGIAHDFNNLLTGILGFADLAAMELRPDDPVREYMLAIVQSSQRAADLCQQMLAYAGQGRYLVGPIQLTNLVREMAPLLKSVTSKSAALRFELNDDLPTFPGDATQIRQMVLNLLTNASEALPESGGVIFLRTGVMRADREFFQSTVLNEQLPEGDYLFLEVEDTGSGMMPDTLKHIFDPFFTTKFKGRGLGLAALLGIVRSHRGGVRVTSEWGVGSTFRIVFPIQNVSKEA
jgi:PAS domain S-box-containing protein